MRDITEIFDTRATLTQKRAYALLYTKLGKYTNLVTQSRLLSFHLKGALLKHERHTAKYNTAFQKNRDSLYSAMYVNNEHDLCKRRQHKKTR